MNKLGVVELINLHLAILIMTNVLSGKKQQAYFHLVLT